MCFTRTTDTAGVAELFMGIGFTRNNGAPTCDLELWSDAIIDRYAHEENHKEKNWCLKRIIKGENDTCV